MWLPCAVETSPASSTLDHDPEKLTSTHESSVPITFRADGEAICPEHTTEAKLMRKIDLRVIPVLCVLYLLGWSLRDV